MKILRNLNFWKFLPAVLLFLAANTAIGVIAGVLPDSFRNVVLLLAVNSMFFFIMLIFISGGDDNKAYYRWRDAKSEEPPSTTDVIVQVKHKGKLYFCKAFYSRRLYKKFGGWGVPLGMLDENNEVILWRYCTPAENASISENSQSPKFNNEMPEFLGIRVSFCL